MAGRAGISSLLSPPLQHEHLRANMIHNLALLVLAALAAAEPAARRVVVPEAPSAPALAYLSAPLVVGAQRAALTAPVAAPVAAPAAQLLLEPGARTVVAYPAAPQQQQYFARTYNGITTLTLEQRDAAPAEAPLVVAPAAPAASRYVLAEPVAAAPTASRYVLAEPVAAAPAPAKVVLASSGRTAATPFYFQAAPQRLVFAAPEPAPAPARVLAVTPQAPQVAVAAPQVAVAAPASSSSQFFSRNFNGVPTVTYFVVGPAPVTAPVAVAPQDAGARPSRRPAPGAVPAGEPVNQGDVEVLDA